MTEWSQAQFVPNTFGHCPFFRANGLVIYLAQACRPGAVSGEKRGLKARPFVGEERHSKRIVRLIVSLTGVCGVGRPSHSIGRPAHSAASSNPDRGDPMSARGKATSSVSENSRNPGYPALRFASPL